MKRLIIIAMCFMGMTVFSQNKNQKASMEVNGVCIMCKKRIEKAAIRTKGVKSAVWNVDTHELKLIYDARKTNLDTIEQNILAVGHDTENKTATDDAYNSVHPCCKYRDGDVKKDHEIKG